jgi:hypothetical protein
MKNLLDTHTFLWFVEGDGRLSVISKDDGFAEYLGSLTIFVVKTQSSFFLHIFRINILIMSSFKYNISYSN